MPPFENLFSWSKSRAGVLAECARAYYYKYYAGWGGWDQPKDSRAWQFWMLGKLSNRYLWKGDMVHRAIERALKGLAQGTRMDVGDLMKWARSEMRMLYKESLHFKYRERPKQFFGLFEHEYNESVSDTTWKDIADDVDRCIEAFFRSRVWREIGATDPATWLSVEELDGFDFEGTPVRVKVDFARRTGPGAYIYDWKTGRVNRDADPLQLGLYALYAREKWGISIDSIHARYLYLPAAQEVPVAIDEHVIDRTMRAMRESIAAMHSLLEAPPANLPAAEESFSFAEDERSCKRCVFRKACARFAGVLDGAGSLA